MLYVNFESTVIKFDHQYYIILPKDVSEQLPSRGMVMIEGTINNVNFKTTLEPDGLGSHWFTIEQELFQKAKLQNKKSAILSVKASNNWIEPTLPNDLNSSLIEENVISQWNALTTKARWQWIRWIRSTKNQETRLKRIKTTCSMLSDGKKRPCCFDHSKCSITSVSKNGILSIKS